MTMLCYNCGQGLGQLIADVPMSPVSCSSILGTNRPPSQHESDLIKDTVANILPRLAHLEEEVAQVQAVLNNLTAQRNKLRDYWTTHKRHLSPILRFPPEIMGEIFLYSLWHPYAYGFPRTRAVLTPGQVCKFWRQVSLATPRMWSNIFANTSSPKAINCRWIDAWLTRSSRSPLSIYIGGYSSKTKRVLSKLTRHIHRWEKVAIDIGEERLVRELGAYMSRTLSVRTLSLERSDYVDTPSPMTFRVAMPKLQYLRFHQIDPSSPFVSELPWSQLVGFKARGHECVNHLDRLRTATNLSSLTIQVYFTEPTPSIAPLHLPLHTFNVSETRPCTYVAENASPIPENRLLDLLTLPNLQTLKGEFQTPPCRAIVSLLSRSNCSLKSLQLTCHNPMLEDKLVEILRQVPALLELRYRGEGFQDSSPAFLRHLALDPSLVPELRTLSIAPCSASLKALILLVLSRSRTNGTRTSLGNTCLQSLQLDMTPFDRVGHEREEARCCIKALGLLARTSGLYVRLLSDGREVTSESLFPALLRY